MSLSDIIRSSLMPSPKPSALQLAGVHLYGDSIMAGGIGDRLRAAGIALNDFAQPGDTAANAWRRFAYDTRSFHTVVLEHGTNDLTGGNDPVPFLAKIAEHALAEGRTVVFTGITQREMPSRYNWRQANDDIEALARSLGCKHAGWHMAAYSSSDTLHPDAAMADRIAARLVETLQA